MGKYDYVRDVFIELGVEKFWKVAQNQENHCLETSPLLCFGLLSSSFFLYYLCLDMACFRKDDGVSQ